MKNLINGLLFAFVMCSTSVTYAQGCYYGRFKSMTFNSDGTFTITCYVDFNQICFETNIKVRDFIMGDEPHHGTPIQFQAPDENGNIERVRPIQSLVKRLDSRSDEVSYQINKILFDKNLIKVNTNRAKL